MGYGGYSREAHEVLTSTRVTLPVEQVFTQRACHPQMNPYGVAVRESRDSVQHPDSLAIVFALDVSGSMGEIPASMAKQTLPGFMQVVMNVGVKDPQIMFMGIGDARQGDRAPVQVGQFESEADLMDAWLTRIYLEGGGGGIPGESYDHAMYFASRHTAIDCLGKRGRRGYLFITGDEPPFADVQPAEIKTVIGSDLERRFTIEEMVREVCQKYHVFFVIPGRDRAQRYGVERRWRDLLGDQVIVLENSSDVCEVCGAIVALQEGVLGSTDEMIGKLKQMGRSDQVIGRVLRSIQSYANSIGRGEPRRQY